MFAYSNGCIYLIHSDPLMGTTILLISGSMTRCHVRGVRISGDSKLVV